MLKTVRKIYQELSYRSGAYKMSPEFCSLIITNKCNFKCRMCSFWQKEHGDELSSSNWNQVVDKLKAVLNKDTFIEISGGEPLMRKDLVFDLIQKLKKSFNKVYLNSNGLLLDNQTVNELKEVGLDAVKLSLYSLDSAIYNELRGHDEAFKCAKAAVKTINEAGLELEIGLLLTSKNIKQAPELIQYLQSLPKTSIIIQPLDEKVESYESKDMTTNSVQSELWPSKEDVSVFFDWLSQNCSSIKNSPTNLNAIREYYLNPERVLNYRCFAGQRNLIVYPNGDSSFCFKRKPIGNLIDSDLKDLLVNAKQERLQMKKCLKYCRIIGCNFSRGLKEYFK